MLMVVWITLEVRIPTRAEILTHKKTVSEAGSAQMLPPWWIKTDSGLPTSKLPKLSSQPQHGASKTNQ